MSEWTVQALVATTLLMALVLLLRGPVSRAFGAKAAYALWALPALRMVMPSVPRQNPLYVPVFHLGEGHSTVGLVDPVTAAHLGAPLAPLPPLPALADAPAGPVTVETIHWSAILLTLWLGGAVVWFGWQMVRYHGFLRSALRKATLLTRECDVDVWLSDAVDGPVAAGIFKKRIFLPADFMERYGPRERRLALLHEGAHHDRRDILANLVALAMLALHWWNPLAHRAYRRFRADQELACDATVLAGMGGDDRYAYGSAVLKSASARMPGVACALSHKDELKRRLQEMARKPLGSPRQWLGFAVALAATGVGLAATASASTPHAVSIVSQADLDQIRADAEQARRDALREAAEARREADQARREGMKAAEQGRREAEAARREALAEGARARAEGLRQAEQARREALAESAQARAEGLREAEQGRAEALRGAAQARLEGQRAAAEGRREAEQGRLMAMQQSRAASGEAARQIALTKQRMAAECAAKGRPISATLDWTSLSLCGDTPGAMAHREVARAMHEAGME